MLKRCVERVALRGRGRGRGQLVVNMWGYPYKTAIKEHNEAYTLFIGVSRWLRPSLWGRGRGRGHYLLWVLCVLFFCVLLWEIERTHSMRYCLWDLLGRFISHRTHRSNRTFWCTVSSSQNASGIQISQNVIAKEGCWMLGVWCWWLAKGGCKVLWIRLT